MGKTLALLIFAIFDIFNTLILASSEHIPLLHATQDEADNQDVGRFSITISKFEQDVSEKYYVPHTATIKKSLPRRLMEAFNSYLLGIERRQALANYSNYYYLGTLYMGVDR